MGECCLSGAAGFFQHRQRFLKQAFLPHTGDKSALNFELSARAESIEDGFAQSIDALAGESGNRDLVFAGTEPRQVGFVRYDQETALFTGLFGQLSIVRESAVEHDDSKIRIRHGLEAAFDS